MLKFLGIRDFGILDRERAVFKAEEDEDVGRYIILANKTYVRNGERRVLADIISAFWIPDKQVLAGDLVVLYTKSGISGKKENTSGSTSYFFYWGKESTIWNTENVACVFGKFIGRATHFIDMPEDDDLEPK